MRKLSSFFTLIVFLLSIIIINYYGLNYKLDEYNPVTEIQLYNVSVSDGLRFFGDEYRSNVEGNNTNGEIFVEYVRKYQQLTGKDQLIIITPKFLPDMATNTDLIFKYPKNNGYRIEENAFVPILIFENLDTNRDYLILNDIRIENKTTNGNIALNLKIYIRFVDE